MTLVRSFIQTAQTYTTGNGAHFQSVTRKRNVMGMSGRIQNVETLSSLQVHRAAQLLSMYVCRALESFSLAHPFHKRGATSSPPDLGSFL